MSQQNESPAQTQLPDAESIEDINSKNFEEFNKESIFNLIANFKCNAKCVRAFAALNKDMEIQQYYMQNEEVTDDDKKKALFRAARDARKLKKLDKLFSVIKEDDFRQCIQEANKEWMLKQPKKIVKVKTVPKCFQSN